MGLVTGVIIGAGIGLAAINVMALIAKNGSRHHDEATFASDADVIGTVDAWARDNGYYLASETGQTRVYRKGKNLLTAPMFLEVTREGQRYTFRSYTQINGLIVKGNMALSGDGFMAKLPRSMARKAQNTLLASLGQPGIA